MTVTRRNGPDFKRFEGTLPRTGFASTKAPPDDPWPLKRARYGRRAIRTSGAMSRSKSPSGGRCHAARALEVPGQIAAALGHAHGKGVVYRHPKPALRLPFSPATMRRMVALLRRIALGSVVLATLATAQVPRPVEIQILAINDFHGNLDPPSAADGMVNKIPAGGIEYLATHLRNAERDNPNSIVVAAGDLMGASPLISALFQDGPTIEALNALNLEVTSVGNHEFDHGPEELSRRVAAARYQYLAANVVKAQNPSEALLPATAVRIVGGVKIGFIGETLEGTARIVAASSVKDLRFLEESSVANAAAAQLERDGVHAIVLLIHEGGQQYPANGLADPNGCENLRGAIGPIARKLSSAIKVVISAHTHQFYNCEIAGHTVTSAGSYGRLFTRVNLSIDAANDRIVKVSAKNEIVTRDVPKDAAETAIIERFRPEAARLANRPAGFITDVISRARNDAGESALGDVIADAQLASVSAADKGGAVVAFMNAGGIRADVAGHPDAGGRREVAYNDLYTAQPFGNQVTVITMTGDMIRRLLEEQFRGDDVQAPILQVSGGFTYRYRLRAPAGAHVIAGSITLNGRAIAPSDRVRIATTDFLVTGGDGFTVFGEGADSIAGPVDVDALDAYFSLHSPVAPGPQNRIVRVD